MFFIEFGHEFLEFAGGFPFDITEEVPGEVGAYAIHIGLKICADEAGYGEFDVFA